MNHGRDGIVLIVRRATMADGSERRSKCELSSCMSGRTCHKLVTAYSTSLVLVVLAVRILVRTSCQHSTHVRHTT
jgi:hypothetical protein